MAPGAAFLAGICGPVTSGAAVGRFPVAFAFSAGIPPASPGTAASRLGLTCNPASESDVIEGAGMLADSTGAAATAEGLDAGSFGGELGGRKSMLGGLM